MLSRIREAAIRAWRTPLVRGMASYAITWPVGSLVQQTIEGKDKYDLYRVARFSLYGSLYVAPTLTTWLTFVRTLFPQATLTAALARALVEQVSYTPFAITSFYFGMTMLEGKGVQAALNEVEDKFYPTYKVAIVIWPILQTVNHSLIAEKNRVVYVSICSLVWTSFLAYMKHLQSIHFKEQTSHTLHTSLHDKSHTTS